LNYDIGELVDLFIAAHIQRAQQCIEIGYNPSFAFNARIHPNLADAAQKTDYIRNSFYGIYKYRFLIKTTNQAIALGFSYGFEPTPKVYGNKSLVSAWASWGANF